MGADSGDINNDGFEDLLGRPLEYIGPEKTLDVTRPLETVGTGIPHISDNTVTRQRR